MLTLSVQRARELAAGFRTLKLTKPVLPALRCLRFTVTPGHCEVQATNLSEWLTHSAEATTTGTASLLVPFELFAEAVKTADAKSDLALNEAKDGWELTCTIGGQGVTHAVPPFDLGEFPKPWVFPESAQPMPAGIIRTFMEAMAAASTDTTRYILNGVWLSPTHVVATDGRQIFASNSLALKIPGRGMIFPTAAALKSFDAGAPAALLFRTETAPIEGAEAIATHAAIRQGAWTWAVKIVEGSFPEWSRAVPKEESMLSRIVFSEADATRLQRVLPKLPGAAHHNAPVTLVVTGSGAELRTAANGSTVNVGLTDSVVTGPPVTVGFNRGFLVQSLAHGFRALNIRDERTPVLMREGNRTHLWMPVRLEACPSPSAPAEPEASPVPVPSNPPTETKPQSENNNMVSPNSSHTPESPVAQPAAKPAFAARICANPEQVAEYGPLDTLLRAKELLRELQTAITATNVEVRELVREKRAVEKDLEALKRNLRVLKTVEV